MPQPLRSSRNEEDEGPESPEALLISALLEEGEFDPARWQVSDTDLACWTQLWKFCCDHQASTGRAPSVDLVNRRWPDFELTRDIDPGWAAAELRKHAFLRSTRGRVQSVINAINDQDANGAWSVLESMDPPPSSAKAAIDAFDVSNYEEEFELPTIEVPWNTLGRATGGIGAGHMWALSARTEQGKTNVACGAFVPRAVMAGWNVAYWTLEMPAREIAHMCLRGMCGRDKETLALLDSDSKGARKAGVDVIRERAPGKLDVIDFEISQCTPDTIRDTLISHDLVVVDHIGLVKLPGGRRSISDRRFAAEISNRLKEDVLRYQGRLLNLTQINREGASDSVYRLPKLEEMPETDVLGQDHDVVVTMKRFSTTVMIYEMQKGRRTRGAHPRWWSIYDPTTVNFAEIKRERAEQLSAADDDARQTAQGY